MAKFLTTTGISHNLEEMIENTHENLVLISPFLKLNDRIKLQLKEKSNENVSIQVVYGKNEMKREEYELLKSLPTIQIAFYDNLHAKCYLNEKSALITSMNLYDFSQANNAEMGIYVENDTDSELYDNIHKEVNRLKKIGEDEIDNQQTSKKGKSDNKSYPKNQAKNNNKRVGGFLDDDDKPVADNEGHCIRCSEIIDFDPSSPYCYSCYKTWNQFKDPDYEENYCHKCGKSQNTTMNKPLCFKCFKQEKASSVL